MCGRYGFSADSEDERLIAIMSEIETRYAGKPELGQMARGEVFPTAVAPVLANNRRHEIRPFLMKWGMKTPSGATIINARSETAMERPMFKESMLTRRCVIPAECYYEWQNAGAGKIKYSISPRGAGFASMAGIYRLSGTGALPEFAILTRQAAPDISFIHKRMPVILPGELADEWLSRDGDVNSILKMAREDMVYNRL